MASDMQSQRASLWLVILIIVLLALGIFFTLPLPNTRTSTTTQSATPASCPAAGQTFDAQQEAFVLAQSAEQYRRANPFKGNYGLGSYIVCLTDGTLRRVQSMPFRGFYSRELPLQIQHITHSEQYVYDWLQGQLASLSINQSKITAIYAIIFSQVIVCDACRQDMVDWQRILRQKARTNNLYLSLWQLSRKKGFNPATYPAGISALVTIADVEEVEIDFAP